MKWVVNCYCTIEVEADTPEEAEREAESILKADTHPWFEYEAELDAEEG